jgi:hypothetical protein
LFCLLLGLVCFFSFILSFISVFSFLLRFVICFYLWLFSAWGLGVLGRDYGKDEMEKSRSQQFQIVLENDGLFEKICSNNQCSKGYARTTNVRTTYVRKVTFTTISDCSRKWWFVRKNMFEQPMFEQPMFEKSRSQQFQIVLENDGLFERNMFERVCSNR